MKLHKFVSYASLAVIALALVLLASLPIRFPHSSIAWGPALLFLSPAVVLVLLPFAKQVLPSKAFFFIVMLVALAAILVTLAGWISPIFSGIFLVACAVLCIFRKPGQT